ncbi:MAG: BamA/TamA family outer membrane protein [Bacteroidales bacterium]
MRKLLFCFFLTVLLLSNYLESYSQEHVFISKINIYGNIKTDSKIILRELPFKTGELVNIEDIPILLKEARNNLLNLSLFNIVQVYESHAQNSYNNYADSEVSIIIEERWYYWPLFGIILEEKSMGNWLKDPDWNYVTLETGIKANNIAGKNQTLKAVMTNGFNKGFYFEYSNINLSPNQKHLMDIIFKRSYSRVENVLSLNDQPYYIKSDSTYLNSTYSTTVTYIYRHSIHTRHKITADFTYKELDPAVLNESANYWGCQELKRRAYSLSYELVHDKRDKIQYPHNGYFLRTNIGGYTTNRFDIRHFSINGDLHYYGTLVDRLFYSARLQGEYSWSNTGGYIFDRAIGYDLVTMRGYYKYVADGQKYMIFSPTIKYNILPQTQYYLKFIPSLPKFNKFYFSLYGRIFSDIGYAWHNSPSEHNSLSNRLLYSLGAGLDIVAYYDITLALDYSLNHFGEHNFHISLSKPIK